MAAFVAEQVLLRGFGNSNEFFDELVRMEQDRQQLRSLLLKGADSALPTPADGPYFDSLRTRVKTNATK